MEIALRLGEEGVADDHLKFKKISPRRRIVRDHMHSGVPFFGATGLPFLDKHTKASCGILDKHDQAQRGLRVVPFWNHTRVHSRWSINMRSHVHVFG